MKDFVTHVIGDGAVGTTVAISFAASNCVHLYGRKGPISGSRTLINQEKKSSAHFKAPIDDAPCRGLFIFAVKAYALETAVVQHLPRMASGSTVLVLCNGHIDPVMTTLANAHRQFHWHRGVVVFGATKESADIFKLHTAKPKIFFKLSKDEVEANLILQTSTLFVQSEDMLREIQLKLFANLVMNTLTAAYDLPTNAAVSSHQTEFDVLVDESFDLLEVLYPANVHGTKSEFQDYLKSVLALTKSNTNSMVVDLRSKRQTEIEYLSGIVSHLPGYSMLKKLHGQILASQT